ncbi:hypothetical protein B7H23_03940 [Notoacmeibacter marinus]|uniref:N-acetyltransferase domain-containing protein n=1 Tax=Notoacmeibacter marinus TaxID=1876515 RepID=A0A231V1L7_9HYPH|nr:GNAT family N-acetyltransferase [Notoacmeibacter marinus]OXT02089.1 hypothetical protein B7H23_03940 [Notoacmeibacter marinus]
MSLAQTLPLEDALQCRQAGADDAAALLRLIGQPDYNGEAMDEAGARRVLDAMAAYPFYRAYLFEDALGVAGMVCLIVMDNLGHRGAPVALVENVIVAEDRQGQGLGRAMIAEMATLAERQGAYKLILATSMKREGAHGFYERLGFERYGYSYGLPLQLEDEA